MFDMHNPGRHFLVGSMSPLPLLPMMHMYPSSSMDHYHHLAHHRARVSVFEYPLDPNLSYKHIYE